MNDDLVIQALHSARLNGDWYRAICPFCPMRYGKPDRRGSFGVHVSGKYHCFRCNASGRLDRMPESFGVGFVEQEPAPVMEPPEGFQRLTDEPLRSSLVAEPARAYLRQRGLREDLWAPSGIGAVLSGWLGGRVVVPVMGGATWLGWVARAWTKRADVPYLYPKGMKRGVLLYNHDALAHETDEPVMVVEGVFDALHCWPDGVAVLGKPSEWQFEALAEAPRPVCVVLDGDAHHEGWAMSTRLRMRGQRAGYIRLPPRIDPDEIEIGELRAMARASLEA